MLIKILRNIISLPANTKINHRRKKYDRNLQAKRSKDEISEGIKSEVINEQPQENEKNSEELKDSTYKKTGPDILPKAILKDTIAKVKDTSKQTPASFSETAKHPKKTKWKVGILFSGGISRVGNSFLN